MTAARTTGTYLDRILTYKASWLEDFRARNDPARIHRDAECVHQSRGDFDAVSALLREHVSIIAEFKRASPSRGDFGLTDAPDVVAKQYVDGGCAVVSCLTDECFFRGSFADLESVSNAVPVGVLCKEFVIDPLQIDFARAHGASMILLIVAALDDEELRSFREHAEGLGMATLVEVHDEMEAERALRSGATVVGVNNRDLRTFDVDLMTTARVASSIPDDAVLVGESGIVTRDDVGVMASCRCSAVLVGESLIRQPDRVAAVRALTGVPRG